MTILDRLASSLGRRDDVHNQELAKELAAGKKKKDIDVLAGNLWNGGKTIQSDCIKVLYEVGYMDPSLISPYTGDFLKLLESKNNRLVWGAMIALSCIAGVKPSEIYESRKTIMKAVDSGSVITAERGLKALSIAASAEKKFSVDIMPFLLERLRLCRPRDVAMYAEYISAAVNEKNAGCFFGVLDQRTAVLTPPQKKRVMKLYKQFNRNP